jgi:tetratricopeptide (TPR) repeat protein
VRLAETPAQVFIGHSAQVVTCFYGGRFAEAVAVGEQVARLHEPSLRPELAQVYGEESTLLSCTCELFALWMVGRPEAAMRTRDAMLATVEALPSPFPLAFALLFDVFLSHELRDAERVASVAGRLLALAGEHEFALLYALAHCGKGWADCQQGDLEGGAALIQTGLDRLRATGSLLADGYWSSYLAEAHLAAGRLADGLAITRNALVMSETQLDVFYEAGILRLQAELLRASGDAEAAEADLRKALAVARAQGALSLELRAAMSLARLLAEQGRAAEALPDLRAAYEAFQEGFATRDLKEARELLDRLASP